MLLEQKLNDRSGVARHCSAKYILHALRTHEQGGRVSRDLLEERKVALRHTVGEGRFAGILLDVLPELGGGEALLADVAVSQSAS